MYFACNSLSCWELTCSYCSQPAALVKHDKKTGIYHPGFNLCHCAHFQRNQRFMVGLDGTLSNLAVVGDVLAYCRGFGPDDPKRFLLKNTINSKRRFCTSKLSPELMVFLPKGTSLLVQGSGTISCSVKLVWMCLQQDLLGCSLFYPGGFCISMSCMGRAKQFSQCWWQSCQLTVPPHPK